MRSVAFESGVRQTEVAAVGTDLQQGDLDYADDRYADDHTDDAIEFAADDDSKKQNFEKNKRTFWVFFDL